ncbi:MAG: serine hydrolase domain-containing protein [Acidimicrobiales bacterium]|jgi:CubicO group peptidase (beta-lactamase class C family)
MGPTAGVHDLPVSGHCDEQFAPVREEFVRNFVERGEVGAAVSVLVDGEPVIDLVGGWADADRTRPWQADTLVDVYSVGKAMVALVALQLVDSGVIGLDDPVASVWPEFATAGKESATIRHALCHRAGVPAIRQRLVDTDLWDWDTMTAALAATEPWWEPGTRHAYHTNTYGHLIGGIVHRATGELPGSRLRALAEPIGADIWCGLPEGEQVRCADVIWALPGAVPAFDLDELSGDDLMVALSYVNPPGYSSMGVVNTSLWRAAQVPSTNCHATAAGVAHFYRALLEPGRLLSPELLAEATSAQSVGFCPVLGEEVTFGLGFKPTTPRRPFGPNPSSFGHFGTGGAVGFGDPDASVAFGYAMNHVIPRWQSSRNRALIDAVYRSL